MRSYEQLYELRDTLPMKNLPSSNWSDTSGWWLAEAIDEVTRQEAARVIQSSEFISASLDESDGRMSVHVYTVTETFEHRHMFVGLPRIVGKPDAANLTALFHNSLTEAAELPENDLRSKLTCIAADGAAVLQGDLNGLIARVQRELPMLWAIIAAHTSCS